MYYCLFVTFFPQLIAGPIVHHKEMLPQFASEMVYKLKSYHLSIGITLFTVGLFKKVVLADNIAIYATPVFAAAQHGLALTFFEAWGGALAYTLQLYFDFSGYSDMAIGIARMLGIVLPVNFYSPYKASNIIDFWRRWHVTLSRFLRDYLYIPLGGNRKGRTRRYANLMITMLLGGFWHGAGWTFIIWGGLHGVFLLINHGWKTVVYKMSSGKDRPSFIRNILGKFITFLAVVAAWVVFRSENLLAAKGMYAGMFGYNGISLPRWVHTKYSGLGEMLTYAGFTFNGMFSNGVFGQSGNGVTLIFLMMLIVWFLPNTLDWMRNKKPALGLKMFLSKQKLNLVWKPNILYALIITVMLVFGIIFIQQKSEFLYFQF